MFGRNVAEEICSKRLYSYHYTVKHMHEYYVQENRKIYYAITSCDTQRTTQHSEVSKYQLISQPKLDKFQSQCYSKCSKWCTLDSTQ